MSTTKNFTVNDAAKSFGKTTGRIRQICREHDIGTVIEDRIRLLTDFDMRHIEQILGEIGRDFSGKTSEIA